MTARSSSHSYLFRRPRGTSTTTSTRTSSSAMAASYPSARNPPRPAGPGRPARCRRRFDHLGSRPADAATEDAPPGLRRCVACGDLASCRRMTPRDGPTPWPLRPVWGRHLHPRDGLARLRLRAAASKRLVRPADSGSMSRRRSPAGRVRPHQCCTPRPATSSSCSPSHAHPTTSLRTPWRRRPPPPCETAKLQAQRRSTPIKIT